MRPARTSRLAAAALVALAALALAGAGCIPLGPQRRRVPATGLLVSCSPADADVFVDDRYLGPAAHLAATPRDLPPGLHRVELRRAGYYPHLAEVRLRPGFAATLEVRLRPALDEP